MYSPSLTSNTPHTRARGVQLLSLVIQQCYGDLSESEVEVLIAFYENRLKDHYVIIPFVLQGLKALVSGFSLLPAGSAVSMLRSLFQDTHVQVSLHCPFVALLIYTSFELFTCSFYSPELKGLGADFVFGFVQSMDGERDPRNLVLAFQIANNIIHRGYDLGKFAEELFEVTSCYFPVDFSPPPNDPHGITQETLILSLRAVLAGTPRFAEFLLPLIIEKLDSDIQSAKIDSLQTLTACLSTYEHKDLAEFLSGLWTSIRREVFQTASERVEGAGLAALTALTSCLSRAILSSDSEDSLNAFLDVVLKDCQHHLCEPDLKLVWPSAKLLQAACSASYRASHIVAAVVIPGLVEQYNSRTQCAHRRTILEVLQGFIHTVKNTSQSEDDGQNVLLAQRDSLCAVVFSALAENNSDLQVTSMRVLSALGQQNGSYTLNTVCVHLQNQQIWIQDHVLLTSIHFHIKYLPLCCASEPMVQGDGCTPSNESSQHAVRQRCVSALAAVSTQPSVVRESAPVLLEVLKSAHTGSGGFSVDEVVAVCFSLQRIADQALDSEETGRFFHDIIIPRLLTLALQAALQGKQKGFFAMKLQNMSITSGHVPSYTSAAKCYAGLVNKRPAGQFSGLTPLAKGLLLRYHPLSTALTDKLFALLGDPELGPMVGDGFSLLMSDSADVLNRGCHADVRIMYRQRFFTENSAKLLQGFDSAAPDTKSSYLKALCHLVSSLPKEVQLTELPALLSLLLEALSCPDQVVQLSTLSCLVPVLTEPPPALIQQLEALVSRLLALTCSPTMTVRIESLRCLHAMSRFPEHEVIPLRARVLRALAKPLDDRKRLVRSVAVQARADWFLLGSPGGR
uniref:MMS19 nucleotide excision repair protein n=1 Tax=Gadus morhua TaxID=8049 RepID=A0A8C5FMU4_GADMO